MSWELRNGIHCYGPIARSRCQDNNAFAKNDTKPVAPNAPTVKAPSSRGPRQLRTEWEALQKQLTRDGELNVDMSDVSELQRPAIAQIIRFLQNAEASNTVVKMINVTPKAHAMLEILGIHHLVEITSKGSQR